jgi:hypothetical protein
MGRDPEGGRARAGRYDPRMPMLSRSRSIRRWTGLLVGVAMGAVVTACGVTADTTAGSVGDSTVSVDDVEALARDAEFIGMQGEALPESRLPGDLARTVLAFELERAALLDELSRWGLEVTEAERSAAETSLAADEAGEWEALAPRTRELLADYFAAQQVLAVHFAQLGTDDDTLRRFYEASPALWAQTCATVVAFEPAEADAAVDALGGGTDLEALPDRIEGAEVVASADQQCIDDAQVLPQLREAFADAAIGDVPDPVVVETGMPSAFLFRVDERRVVGFDDARPRLEEIVTSLAQQGPMPWVRLMLVHAEIDPRYGSGVVQNPDGSVVIEPPATPPVPTTVPDPAMFEDFPVGDVPLDEVPPGEVPLDEASAG